LTATHRRAAATPGESEVRMSVSFLEAIRADPDDDTPRLVFADWLDENKQPDRAALIRTQIV
jgi:uncharacterized protein (TIGR02996 family)